MAHRRSLQAGFVHVQKVPRLHSPPGLWSRHALHTTSTSRSSSDITIFSGIQPTGIPHLGNYLGALRPWSQLQSSSPPHSTLYFSIVDLHSLTSRSQSPEERRQSKREGFAALLACGLDPERSIIYHQSAVPQHTELHWILSCEASMGALTRMTQWKSKLADDGPGIDSSAPPGGKMPWERQANDSTERLKLGLFSYPVLQAADILLYQSTHVPVGEDQVQHIEFARNLATAFNSAYGKPGHPSLLLPPECVVSPAKRVMSLTEPTKKMSKSHASKMSRILLNDAADTIRKKFRSALTDPENSITYDPPARPGVSNLIEIIANLDDGRSCQDVVQEFQQVQTEGSALRLLKERAADLVVKELAPVSARYTALMGERNGKGIDDIAVIGAEKARAQAEVTMKRVRRAIGL